MQQVSWHWAMPGTKKRRHLWLNYGVDPQHVVLSVVLALNSGAPACGLVQAATSACPLPVRPQSAALGPQHQAKQHLGQKFQWEGLAEISHWEVGAHHQRK